MLKKSLLHFFIMFFFAISAFAAATPLDPDSPGFVSVSKGGTGAGTAPEALVDLGAQPSLGYVIPSGLDPTGVLDSSAAVQATVTAMASSGADTLYLPTGKYYFANAVNISTLYQNIRITGAGMAGYVALGRTDGTYIKGAPGLTALFTVSANTFGLEVDHIRFDGGNNSTGVNSAFKFTASGYPARPINFHNNEFQRFNQAIYVTSTSSSGICQVNIENNSLHANNYSVYATGSYICVQDFRFVANVAEAGASIYFDQGTLSANFLISDNLLESNTNTITIGGNVAMGEISRNYFEGNTGPLVTFTGVTGAEELRLGPNFYSGDFTTPSIKVFNAKLTNLDFLQASAIPLIANRLSQSSDIRDYTSGATSINYLTSTDAYVANTLAWRNLANGNYPLSSGSFNPTFVQTGNGSTFITDPGGTRHGAATISTSGDSSGQTYTITDASGLAVGDYVVVCGLLQTNSSTSNKYFDLQLQNNTGTQIGAIGASTWYPFYRQESILIPFHVAILATATSTGTYKLNFTGDTNSFVLADFYVYHATAANAASGFHVRYPNTKASGVATVAQGATTATVTHGMPYAPYNVQVTAGANAGYSWVSSVGASTFVVNIQTAAGVGGTPVYWTAY